MGRLGSGERQLEVAMCMATRPRVLLLDEPLAGMGAEETERMLALSTRLESGHAVLLVEHDMDAVFRIADRIKVMVDVRAIASGTPREIREACTTATATCCVASMPSSRTGRRPACSGATAWARRP